MDSTTITVDQQIIPSLSYFLSNVLLPIVIAIVTYLLVDRLGEWKNRKKYSRLGVAIIECLQEEIKHGIEIMQATQNRMDGNNQINESPPNALLPNKSWNGMTTIPDNVLLRIIEVAADKEIEEFPPKECRIHCKNYFEHMCGNYNNKAVPEARKLFDEQKDWRDAFKPYLNKDTGIYLQSADNVLQMLEGSKIMLQRNSNSLIPK